MHEYVPGPALGMFEVFGRTGPPTLGAAILEPKNQKCCNQMRFASIQCSKMRLRPPLGELTSPPDPLAGFKGAASRREGEGEWREGGGREMKGKGRRWAATKRKRMDVRGG